MQKYRIKVQKFAKVVMINSRSFQERFSEQQPDIDNVIIKINDQ